jgi:hypothetical protein
MVADSAGVREGSPLYCEEMADWILAAALLGGRGRVAVVTTKDVEDSLDGLGEREGVVGLGRGIVGEGEGDGAEAANEGAEKEPGVVIGDAAGAVLKKSAEEEEDGGANFAAVECGEGAAEVEPRAERGIAVAEGGDRGLGRVLAAENVAGGSAAAAALPVGEEKTAFHGSLRTIEKATRRGGLFYFLPYKIRISY